MFDDVWIILLKHMNMMRTVIPAFLKITAPCYPVLSFGYVTDLRHVIGKTIHLGNISDDGHDVYDWLGQHPLYRRAADMMNGD